jgi:nitrate/TMAO reductase-like tetraheme cytochrome c subunit
VIKHHKKSLLTIVLFAGTVLILARCINQATGKDPRGVAYAGAASCRQCHQAVYDSFMHTAHFKATSPALVENIHGNFSAGKNTFTYGPHTAVAMEQRDSGFYQVVYKDSKETAAYRFDIIFGCRNAQTSLYWLNDQTFELPVSYYNSVNTWGTSPGFSAAEPNFGRFVGTDCFECHSSSLDRKMNASIQGITQTLEKTSLLYGIDCERCHGPALNHVNYHLENPGEKAAAYIVKNSLLTQQQKLDACAVCHSGNDKMKIESRFRFKMGDTLGYFFMEHMGRSGTTEFDVHGNQYSLLSQSKCFLANRSMTCATCHDPHKDASDNLAAYSQKCMNCHTEAGNNFCPKVAALGETIKANCIDCHMPEKPSKAISFRLPGSNGASSYLLRTHKIAVYADSLRSITGKRENPHGK